MTYKYKIYDNKAKAYLPMCNFDTKKEAEDFKTQLLHKGEYPDEPHTVFTIEQYKGNKFIKTILK